MPRRPRHPDQAHFPSSRTGLGHRAAPLAAASGLVGFAQFLLAAIAAPLVGLAGSQSAVPMAIVMPVCAASALAALTLAR